MSLTLIEIDGKLYHAQDIYDEEGENVIDTVPFVNEDELIPASVCLCYAFEPGDVVVLQQLGKVGDMITKIIGRNNERIIPWTKTLKM